ncbi:SRPBCC domain-containing protein [Chthonobacter rhizosphaerae]|uniref:SRPBCC domain-containing protein n=1 Tax=Chthonobacter rhizosphaerae TaxID=2735553 RepID=UPI0015EF5D96
MTDDKTSAPASVAKVIRVGATPKDAFDVFTSRMARWWPKTHSIVGEPQADVTMEPQAGGRWFETGESGRTSDWGKVLVWEPPVRLVLTWQIGPDWTFDPALHTEVEVTFTADATDGTLVRLEHSGLEAYGDKAEEMAAALAGPDGWPAILQQFSLLA